MPNILLIVREELVCLIIMCFIWSYVSRYDMGKDAATLKRMCLFSVGHLIFDIITVYTVNHVDTLPLRLNWVCHVIFYVFALLFSLELLCYTIESSYGPVKAKKARYHGYAITAIFVVLVMFIPIEYRYGYGTRYSYGPAVFVGYGLAVMHLLCSLFITALNRKKLSHGTKTALLPMLMFGMAFVFTQAVVPELLSTGAATTIITIGFFYSLANPIVALQLKLQTDALTGVASRRGYQDDLPDMEQDFENGSSFIFLFCDLNDLKTVNDYYGHLEGDKYITGVANIIKNTLVGAFKTYRMGGDEFLIVYRDTPEEAVNREVEALQLECEKASEALPYEISVALGIAKTDDTYTNLSDVLRAADFCMYVNKMDIRRERSCKITENGALNISGLTDRLFDAFSSCDSRNIIYATNLTTNVTRISERAAELLGFDNVFIANFRDKLIPIMHPDDVAAFCNDINDLLTGYKDKHEVSFRIKTVSGEYLRCDSHGTLLHGRGNSPDLIAGIVTLCED